MPVIIYVPPDPTDLVIAGEQLRASAMDQSAATIGNVMAGSAVTGFSSLVPDEDNYPPMNSLVEGNRLSIRRSKSGELMVRANAGIATPCGAWIWLDYTPLINPLLWATDLWTLTGQTLSGAGAALGNCRVVVLETGRMAVDGNAFLSGFSSESPVAAQGYSDGSGNYSIPVPLNTAYWLIAYLEGSPDRAGITRNNVVPTSAVNIYMRDPTVPDSGGAGAVFRPIGSPIVRRIET